MKLEINDNVYDIKTCTSFKERLIGMMFNRDKLNYGLHFPKCSSIHTFFMFQNIDVIMVNKTNDVVLIERNVKPWKILNKHLACSVFEFSTGILKDVKINDKIKML